MDFTGQQKEKLNKMQPPTTWQAFLKQHIADPHNRERLAVALHIRPITLQRWADGISRPRLDNLRSLPKLLPPAAYPLFMHLLILDFPELLEDHPSINSFTEQLPGEFYARLLSNLALMPLPMGRQSTQDLLLQQALGHLDAERLGLSISLAAFVPPRAGRKGRSLREIGGLATPPWPRDLGNRLLLLGAESLVGYAIRQGHFYVLNTRDEITFCPAHWTEHERSAAAFPILLHGNIAGGMIVSSVQEYFFTPQRLKVIEAYSHMSACLFEPHEAFAPETIDLTIMPTYKLQLPYFAGYNRRTSQKFIEVGTTNVQVSLQEIRQLVWQDLEDVVLQVFLAEKITDTF